MHEKTITPHMRMCIASCQECHALCLESSIHCLTMGGEHASAAHQRLLQDCAQACATSADFMLRGSAHHTSYCAACADVCTACATECESMADGDDLMKRCAAACRKCAESCSTMAHEMSH
jgi:hypothetical protein